MNAVLDALADNRIKGATVDDVALVATHEDVLAYVEHGGNRRSAIVLIDKCRYMYIYVCIEMAFARPGLPSPPMIASLPYLP